MVDAGVIAEILVAIGTLALAAVSYLSVQQNRKQLKVLSEQFLVEKAKQSPMLRVHQFIIEGNEAHLTIENIGGGPATWLGLRTRMIPSEKTILDTNENGKTLKGKELQEALATKKQLYWRYDLIHPKPKIVHKSESVGWEPEVAFLVNDTKEDPLLFPGEKETFTIQPTFLITAHKEFLAAPFGYEELKELLLQNGVEYAALSFGLVAKDATDHQIRMRFLADFVADFRRHGTLEDAFKEHHVPYFLLIPWENFVKKGWLSEESYDGSRMSNNALPL